MKFCLPNPNCKKCDGTGLQEVLSLCCGPIHPSLKECGCDADGYTLDEVKPCDCLRPAAIIDANFSQCPDCDGWGRRVFVYESRECYQQGSFPTTEHYEQDCEPCKGTGYRRKANA